LEKVQKTSTRWACINFKSKKPLRAGPVLTVGHN
jgi:hypothetical protein